MASIYLAVLGGVARLDLNSLAANAVIIVAVISFPAVAWFFYFRRVMIKKQSSLAWLLESMLRPVDKTYQLLGYLVGFRADYVLRDPKISKVTILYTTPPYHVFFYLPVITLLGKREKLDIIAWLRPGSNVRGEAHIVDESVASVRIAARRDLVGNYDTSTIQVPGRQLRVYYRGGALDLARRILSRLASRGTRVFRVSVDGSRRAIMVSVEPTGPEVIEEALRTVFEAAGTRLARR